MIVFRSEFHVDIFEQIGVILGLYFLDQRQGDFQVIFGIYFVMFCTRCACFFASSSMLRDWSPSRLADTYLYWIALLWVLPNRDFTD